MMLLKCLTGTNFLTDNLFQLKEKFANRATYQKYGGMTLKDLLYFANGLKPSAEFGSIIVSSIVDMDSSQRGIKPTKTIIKSLFNQPKS